MEERARETRKIGLDQNTSDIGRATNNRHFAIAWSESRAKPVTLSLRLSPRYVGPRSLTCRIRRWSMTGALATSHWSAWTFLENIN